MLAEPAMGVVTVMRGLVWTMAALLASGCPRKPPVENVGAATNTTISVEVEGDTTPAMGQGPGSSLPEPPAPDPGKPHLAYLSRLEQPIQAAWRTFLEDCRLRLPADHALNATDLSAALEIDIGPDGNLAAVRLSESSNNADFDQVAVEIVRDLPGFARPPADLVSDDGVAHLVWRFSRDERQAGVATAELERIRWPPERAVPRLLETGTVAQAARRIELAAAALDPKDTVERERLIGLLNDVAIEAVRESLASDEPKLQHLGIAAARSGKLVSLGDELSVIARSAVDASLRHQAMRALGRVEYKSARPLLFEVLENGVDPAAASAAAAALGALGESAKIQTTAAAWLSSDSEDKRWAALAMLSSVPSAGAVSKLAGLLSGDKSRAEKLAAAGALGVATTIKAKGAMPALIKGLESSDAAVRAACAQSIETAAAAGIRSRVAYRKLLPLLADKDERVRAASTGAAARLDPKRFASELPRSNKETSTVVLESLAGALGAVPSKDARSRLAELAAHKDARVRRSAARALLLRDDDAARKALEQLLEDEDSEVRLIAVGGLGDVEQLSRFLDNESPAVRAAALDQLVAKKGKGLTLGEVSRRLATATLAVDRVLLATAWLSR